MPGWIWAVLVVFMLAVLLSGAVYAFLKAKRSLSGLEELGGRLERLQASLGESDQDRPAHEPALTQPLADNMDRYSQAHARLLTHKRLKRSRHIQTWRRWEQ